MIGSSFEVVYCNVNEKKSREGVILKEDYAKKVLEVKSVRLINPNLEVESVMLNVISFELRKLLKEKDKAIQGISKGGKW